MKRNSRKSSVIAGKALTIFLIIILAGSAYETSAKEKTVSASEYNACVEDYNSCRDLLVQTDKDLAEANKLIDEMNKKNRLSTIKEEAIIGIVVGTVCLALGVGVGFYFGIQAGR